MKPFRVFLTVTTLVEISAIILFFYLGRPVAIAERARYNANHEAEELTAEQNKISIADLHRRAGACPAPMVETDLLGIKQNAPDLGAQLECQNRVLYADNFKPVYKKKLLIAWLELIAILAAAVGASFLVTYGSFYGWQFASRVWWPWVNQKNR